MLLIYSDNTSYRLQYICQLIFKEILGTPYSLTMHQPGFEEHDGPRINYSNTEFEENIYTIRPLGLLNEKDIRQQEIAIFETTGVKAFFKTDGDYPFDIFSASFYLISRYEEYLPHKTDDYGRYAHENALAFKSGFLNKPVVNIWISQLAASLSARYPEMVMHQQSFTFIPTYDIDIAYSFRSKGILRNVGGFFRSPSVERIKVLLGRKQDPFDAYAFMNELNNKHHLHCIYFFLVAAKTGKYDKNVARDSKEMLELLKQHAKLYGLGLHPSWRSYNDSAIIREEKHFLEDATGMHITNSRQHYVKFNLPDTYRQLISAGILNEFSMGYGSINGFRASIASSFYWYDLPAEKISQLRVHPFCFMDANSYYEQKATAEEALTELRHYYEACKQINGTLITIFHNNFLADSQLSGWKKTYQTFVEEISTI